ncbi:MAG: KpsF/GutQ family sugar-phosphate isomerase, partial [Candidatus Eisenbacteria bacterium]|nr:KpsF/GutQ family sugar-phosphate isomerase [Candidatus Eisenbacteria bacterium]
MTRSFSKGLDLSEMEKVTAILGTEIRAIEQLSHLLEQSDLGAAVDLLCLSRGRVIVSGVGKPGIIGQRIAASLRSTGRPAFFLHPVEAIHGDLGLVTSSDVALLLSRSGETGELLALIPTLRRIGIPIIAATCGNENSLAERVDCHLPLGDVEEIPELGEFPTVSNTVFQVLGDILTVLIFQRSGLSLEDLRFLHPGGVIGRQATLRVADVMHSGSAMPLVTEETSLKEALVVIIEKRLGLTCVVDEAGRLSGVVADGDIKRILHRYGDI